MQSKYIQIEESVFLFQAAVTWIMWTGEKQVMISRNDYIFMT